MVLVRWAGLVVLGLVVLSCKVQDPPLPVLPPAPDAASPSIPIDRTVLDAAPGLGLKHDAAPDVAPVADGRSSDLRPPRDAPGSVDLRPDVLRPDGGTSCNLVTQDCANKAHGCYPAAAGTACTLAGGIGEFGECVSHAQCLPGYVCLADANGERICTQGCDRTFPVCPGNGPCRPLTGSAPYGYCEP